MGGIQSLADGGGEEMKNMDEIRIIDKREAEIILQAMGDYMSKEFRRLQKEDMKKLIEINDLIESLKGFVYHE